MQFPWHLNVKNMHQKGAKEIERSVSSSFLPAPLLTAGSTGYIRYLPVNTQLCGIPECWLTVILAEIVQPVWAVKSGAKGHYHTKLEFNHF